MDINKYLTNKDIQLSKDDINVEKLERDIRKGYVLAEEVDKARDEATKNEVAKFTELETKYNSLDKSFNDLQAKNVEQNNIISSLKLQNEMVSQGFKKEQFEEVSKLRTTLYAEEQDDAKAIAGIKEKFGSVYMQQEKKEETKTFDIPNDNKLKAEPSKAMEAPKITRKTPIKNLFKEKGEI